MPQPPTTPVQARELVRSVPFCAQQTYASRVLQPLGDPADNVGVQWDLAAGITDVNQLLTGAYPDASVNGIQHATGPFLDAAAFIVTATNPADPPSAVIAVEYAIDRGCAYRMLTPGTAVPYQTWVNISGLRVTARFVRVTLVNSVATAGHTIKVDFGVYVRSS